MTEDLKQEKQEFLQNIEDLDREIGRLKDTVEDQERDRLDQAESS